MTLEEVVLILLPHGTTHIGTHWPLPSGRVQRLLHSWKPRHCWALLVLSEQQPSQAECLFNRRPLHSGDVQALCNHETLIINSCAIFFFFFQEHAMIQEYWVIHHNTICLKNGVVRAGGFGVKYSKLPQVLLYDYMLSTETSLKVIRGSIWCDVTYLHLCRDTN